MTHYLFIESRDPYEAAHATLSFDLAADLARAGNKVAIFLVQNGVFAARGTAGTKLLSRAAAAGVEVLADEFSLRERGIARAHVPHEVQSAPLHLVVDRLAAGHRTIWN